MEFRSLGVWTIPKVIIPLRSQLSTRLERLAGLWSNQALPLLGEMEGLPALNLELFGEFRS
jgi:hypothetical protein